MINDGPIMWLMDELIEMGFPKRMAKKMAKGAFAKAGKDSKSFHNNLPAVLIDGTDVILIDTSAGLKNDN